MPRDPRQTPAWRRMREQCFRRDRAKDAVCWLCGQPIDYSVRPSTTPDSYEPDHYHTVRDHPELALLPENVRPAHKSCNRSRGTRAGTSPLGTPSRQW